MTALRETHPCGTCGKAVTKLLSQVMPTTKGWYCSRTCSSKAGAKIGLNARWLSAPALRDTRPCDVCFLPVTKDLSQVKEGAGWTCSRSCSGVYSTRKCMEAGTWKPFRKPRRGDTVPCAICSKPFYRSPALIEGGSRFCSPECASKGHMKPKEVKECPQCGKAMYLPPSQSHRIYCSRVCDAESKVVRTLAWEHNGRRARKDKSGYVLIWEPNHVRKTFKGWQYQHRIVIEQSIGRILKTKEHIHHLNGVKDDNRLENLQLLSHSAHASITAKEQREKKEALLAELAEYKKRFGPLI